MIATFAASCVQYLFISCWGGLCYFVQSWIILYMYISVILRLLFGMNLKWMWNWIIKRNISGTGIGMHVLFFLIFSDLESKKLNQNDMFLLTW